ncbi:hypothetical protein OBBRIDRAFT_710297, partial [Obba rivulosa]
RAFVIAARQLQYRFKEPLRMYLGGMRGTGKSRVLLALTYFLDQRDKRCRFLVLAPTGSAACLIDGSTYHSALSFGRKKDTRAIPGMSVLEKIRDRHDKVDLIFIDEVSMIFYADLYRISSHL